MEYIPMFKFVISPKLARILIKKGYVVRDIHENNQIKNATVFVFDNTPELLKEIENFKRS